MKTVTCQVINKTDIKEHNILGQRWLVFRLYLSDSEDGTLETNWTIYAILGSYDFRNAENAAGQNKSSV